MTMRVAVAHGPRQFLIDVAFSDRRSLTLTVYPNLKISARAPLGCCREELRRRLGEKAVWIARQIDFFDQFQPQPPERKYISGETHYYLGRQYRMRIRSGEESRVRLIGRFFEMQLVDPSDFGQAKKLMLSWYASHVQELLSKRVERHLPLLSKLGVSAPRLRFRHMSKRWGSCSESGLITLNTALAKVPLDSIDYVIVHELCHLLCPQHDRKFFRLLGNALPDWARRKARLERSVL